MFRPLLIAVLVFTALAERPSRPEWVKDGIGMGSNREELSFTGAAVKPPTTRNRWSGNRPNRRLEVSSVIAFDVEAKR